MHALVQLDMRHKQCARSPSLLSMKMVHQALKYSLTLKTKKEPMRHFQGGKSVVA